MDNNALFKISYGLYILTAKENEKDNGCVINTLMQVTSDPCIVEIAVNKMNYTTEMIQRTKKFNVSILSTDADFEIFKHFGFQSGKNTDKFKNFKNTKRAENDVLYLTEHTNAFISAQVIQEIELKTHILFIAKVENAQILSQNPTITYEFYQNNIKPKPQKNPELKGFRCKICGYIYKGDILPEDFICPLCKHGASDFEKID